jgi:hypothetical protein
MREIALFFGNFFGKKIKTAISDFLKAASLLARPERFELPTNWFEASYSIQLSYGRIFRTGVI